MDDGAPDIHLKLPEGSIGGFDPATQNLQILFADSQLIVLEKRQREKKKRKATRPRIFADFHQMNMFDGLLLANATHANGTFLARLPDNVEKRIFVKNGDIVFANSNQDADRLGESLIRAGRITQQQLDSAAASISATNKLGKILIDRQLITPRELFEGVRRQVEEIVTGLVCESVGKFVFYEGIDPQADMVALRLETQQLLVHGLRQTPPWADVPLDTVEREVYLTLETNPATMGLNAEERKLVVLVGEGISFRHLQQSGELGWIHTYHHVHRLLLRGVLKVSHVPAEQQPKVESAKRKAIESAITNFVNTYENVVTILAKGADGQRLKKALDSFFQNLPGAAQLVFKDIRYDAPRLDEDRIFFNVENLDAEKRQSAVEFAIGELLNYLVFESHHLVNEDLARQILIAVQKSLRR